MIIEPKIRGFICLTAHPVGCEAHVQEQIDFVKKQGPIENGPKNVLVIGASAGYGLASRITAAFGAGAATLGLFFEREPTERKTATAGWYNAVAFQKLAKAEGLFAESINGDAYSDEVKQQAIDIIKNKMGPIDLVVYSLASPRRTHPKTGEVLKSTLKPIGQTYDGITLDTDKEVVKDIHLEPATEDDISGTVAVMGGEDWEMWMDALHEAGVLAEGCRTVAYTYIGTKLTWPIYWEGTIGKAKEDLDRAAADLTKRLSDKDIKAYVAVMKGLVTQASSAIPVVPLYISLLYKIMKEKGGHEGCIEQAWRLFYDRLYSGSEPPLDEAGRLRLDDLELAPEIQAEVEKYWPEITTENLHQLTDLKGYQAEFLKLFGFGLPGVDYSADVDPLVEMP
ncbi:MAG: enoyl-ACP reductase FabV [Calditrichota bacterium]